MSPEAGTAAPAASTPKGQRRLKVKVFSPYKIFFDGAAKSVSAINAHGPFDILPGHISFFSLLVPGLVAVTADDRVEQVVISHGIAHVRGDSVTVFVFGTAGGDGIEDD